MYVPPTTPGNIDVEAEASDSRFKEGTASIVDDASMEQDDDDGDALTAMSVLFTAMFQISLIHMPNALGYLLFFIESVQTLSVAFSPIIGISPLYSAIADVLFVTRDLVSESWSAIEMIILSCAFLTVTVITCGLFVLTWYRILWARKPSAGSLRFLQSMCSLVKSVCALPALQYTVHVFLDVEDDYPALPMFFMAFVLSLCIGLVAALFLSDRRKSHRFSMIDGRVEACSIVLRLLCIALEHFLPAKWWLLMVSVVYLSLLWMHFSKLPFNMLALNAVRASLFAAMGILCLVCFLFMLFSGLSEVSEGVMITALVMGCLAFILAPLAVVLKVKRVIRSILRPSQGGSLYLPAQRLYDFDVPSSSAGGYLSPADVCLLARFVDVSSISADPTGSMYSKRDSSDSADMSANADSASSFNGNVRQVHSDLSAHASFRSRQQWIQFLDSCMVYCINEHPEHAELYVDYGLFILQTAQYVNSVRGDASRRILLLLREIDRLRLSFDTRFFAHTLKQLSLEDSTGDSLEVIRRAVKCAQWNQSQVQAAYIRFWKMVLNPHRSQENVEEAVAILDQLERSCERVFLGLMESYPRSPLVLRAAASFYSTVAGDESMSQELLEVASHYEDAKSSKTIDEDDEQELVDPPDQFRRDVAHSATMQPMTPQRSGRVRTFGVDTPKASFGVDAPKASAGKDFGHLKHRRSIPTSTTPGSTGPLLDDRDAAASEAGRRSIGTRSSHSFNTNSSEGGLSRNRIRKRPCRTLSSLSKTLTVSWLLAIVFLSVLFGICYHNITSFKHVNDLLRTTAEVQDHMQRLVRYTASSALLSHRSFSILELRAQTAELSGFLKTLAAGLPEAPAVAMDYWYDLPLLVQALPVDASNVSVSRRTNLWQSYVDAIRSATDLLEHFAGEPSMPSSELVSITVFFYVVHNGASSMLSRHDELLQRYQTAEDDRQYQNSVVIQAVITSFLIVIPVIGIAFLFSKFLVSFQHEREAAVQLFDALPKSTVREMVGVCSSGNVWAMAVRKTSEGTDRGGADSNGAMSSAVSPSAAASVHAMSASSARKRLIAFTALLVAATVLMMLVYFMINYGSYAIVRHDPAEIHWSNRMHAHLVAAMSYAFRLMYQDPFDQPSVLAAQVGNHLDQAVDAYQSVRYGSQSRNLPGVGKDRTHLLDILYDRLCSADSPMCSGYEEVFYSVVNELREFSSASNFTAAVDVLESAAGMYDEELLPRTEELLDSLAFENYPKIDSMSSLSIGLFTLSLVLITAIFVALIRPAIVDLEHQRKRLDLLLITTPTVIIFKNDALRTYLVDGEPLLAATARRTTASERGSSDDNSMWLQGLFDCGRDGVLELSDAGHIIKLNKAALIMFAYEQHQLVGRHISHLLRSPGASDKIMRQLASGIRSVSRESSSSSADPSLTVTFPPEESEALRRNETDPFFVSVSMTVIADKARKRGALVLLTMRDITVDRQKSELLSTEKQRSEQLLCNILPKTVAVRMSKGETTIVDACDMVSVLFLDLVGFTSLSATMVPHDLVVTLNEIISGFDDIITRNGCEKIKTIGDAIMVTAGVPDPRPDHARILLQTAMEFGQYLKEVNARRNLSFDFRCGINSGPVVAGVIGKIRTAWDVWGPTVNVASRMESTSLPGRIQVSRSTYEQVYKFYEFEERTVFCKGVGDMTCYLLVGPSRPSDRSG